jgi:hypothetical protein
MRYRRNSLSGSRLLFVFGVVVFRFFLESLRYLLLMVNQCPQAFIKKQNGLVDMRKHSSNLKQGVELRILFIRTSASTNRRSKSRKIHPLTLVGWRRCSSDSDAHRHLLRRRLCIVKQVPT